MTDTLIAIAVVIAALAATWFGGRKSGKTDAKLKTERDQALATAKAEQDRVKLDEAINQDTDLAARARAVGVVRGTKP